MAAEDPLPTEFLIFRAGENPSTQGVTLFDEAAARSVMTRFAEYGNDLVLDLEHSATDERARAIRADAADAMAWFALELRGGDLWAVNVRWTPEGERRLRSKSQRYTSPTFYELEGRVTELINVALVSMPATFNNAPLVAASVTTIQRRGPTMDPEKIKAAMEAIKAGDDEAALSVLEGLIVTEAGGDSSESKEPAAAPEALAETGDPPPESPDPAADPKAMTRALGAIVGSEITSEIIAEVKRLRARADAADAEAQALEESARRDLVGELVKLGVELPATAWENKETRLPVARLRGESVASLRARVAAHRASSGSRLNASAPSESPLSAEDQAVAASITDPQKRARFVALRASRRSAVQ